VANPRERDYGQKMVTSKALFGLAIVVGGSVAALGIYTFGWHESSDDRNARSPQITTETGRHRLYTIRNGDVIRLSTTATECEVSGEAGIPNLFCTPIGSGGRYQVVFWNDRVDVYDLARHGEPMVPTFSVPARLKNK
jgi:hypothetical protein